MPPFEGEWCLRTGVMFAAGVFNTRRSAMFVAVCAAGKGTSLASHTIGAGSEVRVLRRCRVLCRIVSRVVGRWRVIGRGLGGGIAVASRPIACVSSVWFG